MLGVSLRPQEVVVKEFPTPNAGPGEVRVQVQASAICRTDLTVFHGQSAFGTGGDVIAGHEPAGVVDQVGSGVAHLREGDRVAVYLAIGCGSCAACRAGFLMHCGEFACIGFHRHGGDAEFLVVPAANCLPIPDEMSFAAAAVSLDVVGTLFHALRRVKVCGADTVVIFGLGPMGLGGVMVAKALGARVIAVDMIEGRLSLGAALGADHVINGSQTDVRAAVRAVCASGASVAVDCTGNPRAQVEALEVVGVHGRVAWIGGSAKTTLDPRSLLTRKQLTLIGSWYFNISEYSEITDFCLRHKLPLESIVTHRFGLEDAVEAFTLFDQGSTGKVVFTPQLAGSGAQGAKTLLREDVHHA